MSEDLKEKIKKNLPDTEAVSDAEGQGIDESLGLKAITIRLDIATVEHLKVMAKKRGKKYQPFVRMILENFVKGGEVSETDQLKILIERMEKRMEKRMDKIEKKVSLKSS